MYILEWTKSLYHGFGRLTKISFCIFAPAKPCLCSLSQSLRLFAVTLLSWCWLAFWRQYWGSNMHSPMFPSFVKTLFYSGSTASFVKLVLFFSYLTWTCFSLNSVILLCFPRCICELFLINILFQNDSSYTALWVFFTKCGTHTDFMFSSTVAWIFDYSMIRHVSLSTNM